MWLFVSKILLKYSGTTKTPLWRPVLCIDKRDNFNFDLVNFPYLDGDLPHSYGVKIVQLIRFARVCRTSYNFSVRHKILTTGLSVSPLFQNVIAHTINWFLMQNRIKTSLAIPIGNRLLW